MEESQSFGVLGESGRGAVEHWGLKPSQVCMCVSCVCVCGRGAVEHWGLKLSQVCVCVCVFASVYVLAALSCHPL